MRLKMLLIAGTLVGSIAQANEKTFRIEAWGCYDYEDGTQCDFISDKEYEFKPLRLVEPFRLYGKMPLEKPLTSETSRMANMISMFTGIAFNSVKTAVDGLRSTAVAAGYHTFEGTLSGPGGRVRFTYNLLTNKWSLDNN